MGAFYPATVLSDGRKGVPAYDEELFGPVAAIIVVKSEDEAIAVANDSGFGLGAAVFTKGVQRGDCGEQARSRSVLVDASVKSDPRLPFGGVKQFGFGRELSAPGIREFVKVKTAFVG